MKRPGAPLMMQAGGLLLLSVGAGIAYLAAGFILAGLGLVAFGIAAEKGNS